MLELPVATIAPFGGGDSASAARKASIAGRKRSGSGYSAAAVMVNSANAVAIPFGTGSSLFSGVDRDVTTL